MARQVATLYRRLHGGVHKLVPHRTNVCKFSKLCGAIFSRLRRIILKVGSLFILRSYFQWCRRIFLIRPRQKFKKPKKGLLQRVMSVCIGRKLRFNKCIYNFLF